MRRVYTTSRLLLLVLLVVVLGCWHTPEDIDIAMIAGAGAGAARVLMLGKLQNRYILP